MTETAVGFGYKMSWLAVADRPPSVVVESLRLRKPRPISWVEGVDAAYQGAGVLVSPPVDGWSFVLPALKDPSDQGFVDWFGEVSSKLGVVRCFVTHRVSDLHGWARAADGKVERAYCIAEEVMTDFGTATSEEIDIDLPDEGDVMRLAGLWSLSPVDIDGRTVPSGCLLARTRRFF